MLAVVLPGRSTRPQPWDRLLRLRLGSLRCSTDATVCRGQAMVAGNATAYGWHLVDLSRGWSERWGQVAAAPGSLLVGWDPDVLAEKRSYCLLPTVSALWALTDATDKLVNTRRSDPPARVRRPVISQRPGWRNGRTSEIGEPNVIRCWKDIRALSNQDHRIERTDGIPPGRVIVARIRGTIQSLCALR